LQNAEGESVKIRLLTEEEYLNILDLPADNQVS
jgi:hypothetical protein